MNQMVIRALEGEILHHNLHVQRVLATEEQPVGTGTATRRVLTLLVTDGRYWLSDEAKAADPIWPVSSGTETR